MTNTVVVEKTKVECFQAFFTKPYEKKEPALPAKPV